MDDSPEMIVLDLVSMLARLALPVSCFAVVARPVASMVTSPAMLTERPPRAVMTSSSLASVAAPGGGRDGARDLQLTVVGDAQRRRASGCVVYGDHEILLAASVPQH
jgi:hypothetical protein